MSPRPAAGAFATGVAGGALALIALAIGAAPLLVAGLGLTALAALAALIVLPAARGIRLTRRLVSHRVQEGEALDAVLVVRGARRPLVRVELRDPLASKPLALKPGREHDIRLRGAAPRRGRHLLPAPEVVVRDPLGLFRSVRPGGGEAEVLVLPRLEPVRWLAPGTRGATAGRSAGSGPGSEPLGAGEIDGVRPYRHGTPASRIHWPALARGAGLLERQVRPAAEGWPLVALDLNDEATGEAVDAAVRAAASLAVELARRGGVRLALPGERRASEIGPDLAAWPDAHVRLALLDGGPAGRTGPPVRASGERMFLVRAAAPRIRAEALGRETILILPAGIPGPRQEPVLTVAGCRGYVLEPARRVAA